MSPLLHPIAVGPLSLPLNVWYAPLAGCSDWPFRMMSSRWRPGLIFTEMVKMDALVRADRGTYEILHYSDCMHPIGAQLCGSSPLFAKQSTRILADMGFDVIDLNCGCPVDKVVKDGGGSNLLKTPHLIGEIVSSMVEASSVPVTVKIRVGWDAEHVNVEEVVRIAESAGAKAVMVHGRTRSQGYNGNASLELIRRAKMAAKQIPVLGNGDIISSETAFRMLAETGCDGIVIGRATMGRPWIVEDIRRGAVGEPPISFSIEELREILQSHFEYIVTYKNERKALVDMRRVGCWYFSHCARAKAFRGAISISPSLVDVEHLIKTFSFTTEDQD
jgi:nifR3 family TIM-barrel protein